MLLKSQRYVNSTLALSSSLLFVPTRALPDVGPLGGLLGLSLVPQQRWWSRWWEAPRAQRRAPLPRRHLPHGDGAHLGHGNGGALGEMGW